MCKSWAEKMNVVQRSYSIVSTNFLRFIGISPLFFVSTMVWEDQEARKEIPDQISERELDTAPIAEHLPRGALLDFDRQGSHFKSEDNAEQEDWWYP
jgi:hypothetical protein